MNPDEMNMSADETAEQPVDASQTGGQDPAVPAAEDAAREAAAQRERAEKTARTRDLVVARHARTELGQDADPTTEELQALILSADAEAQVSREYGERGETGPHLFRGVDGEHRLTVFGTAHVFESSGVSDLRRVFEEDSPDLVFREGTADFSFDPALSDEQVLERYGEQVYFERLARAKGIEVRSWDVPWVETMRDVLQRGHAPDAIVAWMMSQGTKHILKQGKVPSRETLADVLKVVCTPVMVEALQRDTGVSLDVNQLDLDRIAQEYLGKPLAQLDFETVEAHANPWQRGPTNDILRRMNELRDARAIALIAEAKRAGRRAFVLAGGDHVLAWQPALEALYPQHEFRTLESGAEERLSPELRHAFLSTWSEVISGKVPDARVVEASGSFIGTVRHLFQAELDGHLENLAAQQGIELPPLPSLPPEATAEAQLDFVRALTTRIHVAQNGNNACFTPRLSRELNGMDCSMSTWVMQHELRKVGIEVTWGSPVGHAIGIVTLRNGEQYYADGQGGFVERISAEARPLPDGGSVLDITNWRDIQGRRPSFFPRYVFVTPDGDVAATVANIDSMLYKQHLEPITEAQRQERGAEDVRIVEQLQPYAQRVQDALRPYATDERDHEGNELSPLNRVLEVVFPAANAVYQRPEFIEDESRMSMDFHRARELLGERMVFGPEAVRAAFGIELKPEDVPPIPYSREQLERARESGEVLVLRIDRDAEGRSLTPQCMYELSSARSTPAFSEASGAVQDAIDLDMEFFTREAPRAGWVLVRAGEMSGTRHLSYDAQAALIRKDGDALRRELERIPQTWDRYGILPEQRPPVPTLEELHAAMTALPDGAELPSAADVVYDFLLRRATTGELLITDMSVATRSRVQELPAIDEPERPIDVGLSDRDGIAFHWRRSMDFGRPGVTKPGAVPGIPIGYIQH
ncbi:MAG: hypothetical protein Q7R80_02615 [bacterium]|nr:hypothetical protein [bacterium]